MVSGPITHCLMILFLCMNEPLSNDIRAHNILQFEHLKAHTGPKDTKKFNTVPRRATEVISEY